MMSSSSSSIPKSAMAPVTTLATPLTTSYTSYTYHLCTYVLDYVLSSSRHWYIFLVQQSWHLYSNAWSTPLLTYWGTNFTYSNAINRTTSLPSPPQPDPPSAPNPFRLMELPDELLAAVLTHLPTSERARTSLVCRRFATLLASPAAWRTLTICTSRWSDLKEAKIDAWLARRASPHVLHLQLGSPHYRVRLRRPTLIAQLHGMLSGLQRIDVEHVDPFPAAELLQARNLQRASLRGAACASEALCLSRDNVGASQLTSLTLHAPTSTAPAFPDFVLALHRLQRLSLAAPGEAWRVPEELATNLPMLSRLELASLDSLQLPSTLHDLHTLRELALQRIGHVQGLQHVPVTLRTLRTDGLPWSSSGLEQLLQRTTQLRVLVVRGSGRSEVLPHVLCALPGLETLVLEEDGGWGDSLSLALDNLATLTALRHVELAGSGQQLCVEGEQVRCAAARLCPCSYQPRHHPQLAVLAGLPHLVRFEVRCSCLHSVHGSVDVMRQLREAFADKPAAASLQFRSDSCASLTHLEASGLDEVVAASEQEGL